MMKALPLSALTLGLVTMAVRAHEQELSSLQTLLARDKAFDRRWPVPYAIRFITGVTAALWVMIIVAASWLIV
jgi:hypothetical protein